MVLHASTVLYVSDTHFSHTNIIGYCERPFENVHDMNVTMQMNIGIALVKHRPAQLIHCGDVAWDAPAFFRDRSPLPGGLDHVMICGNHDRIKSGAHTQPYRRWFSEVVGVRKTWRENCYVVQDDGARVLCSHAPQENLQGCDFNVYGHVHDNPDRAPTRFAEEYPWYGPWQPRHLNASVEGIEYVPRTLEELIQRNNDRRPQ